MTRRSSASVAAWCFFLSVCAVAHAESPLVALHPSEVVDAAPKDADRIHALVAAELLRRGVNLAPSEKVQAFISKSGSCAEQTEHDRSECLHQLAKAVDASRALLITVAPWAGDKIVLTAQVVSKSGAVLQDLPPFSRPRSKGNKGLDASITAALADFVPTIELTSVTNEDLVAPLATSNHDPDVTPADTHPDSTSGHPALNPNLNPDLNPDSTPNPAAATATATTTVDNGGFKKPLGIALLVVGAAGLATGAYGFVDANGKGARWNELHQNGAPTPAQDAELASLRNGIQTSQTIGVAGAAVGVAAGAIGAYLFFSSDDSSASSSSTVPTVSVSASPTQAFLTVRFQ